MKTGLTATRLAIAAFIIPFVFAYSPMILFVGESILWYEVALTVITAVIGMIGVAAGLSGYLLGNMNIVRAYRDHFGRCVADHPRRLDGRCRHRAGCYRGRLANASQKKNK